MRVDNNFPNVDSVLRKLKEYVDFFEERKRTHPEEAQICDSNLHLVDDFIEAVGKYLDSVCNGDDRISKVRNSGAEPREIREKVAEEDKARTEYHSAIIINMILIDRMAEGQGLRRVFDYAEEFQHDFFSLTPNSVEEKAEMTERQRVKRRELGNFGLYIGASVTAGMSKEHLISDEEAREFASCEDDKVQASQAVMWKVKAASKGYKNNMDQII